MSVIWDLDDDVLLDSGFGLSRERHSCPRCRLDITDFTEDEAHAHATFHGLMARAPKSIPHQGPSAIQQRWREDAADRANARMFGF